MSDNLERFYKFAEENMFRHTAQEEFAWNVWNAAIASVVVDIPSFFSDRYETDIVYADDMEKALDEAGVRYE